MVSVPCRVERGTNEELRRSLGMANVGDLGSVCLSLDGVDEGGHIILAHLLEVEGPVRRALRIQGHMPP